MALSMSTIHCIAMILFSNLLNNTRDTVFQNIILMVHSPLFDFQSILIWFTFQPVIWYTKLIWSLYCCFTTLILFFLILIHTCWMLSFSVLNGWKNNFLLLLLTVLNLINPRHGHPLKARSISLMESIFIYSSNV